jgi:bifunctional DNA-binding transcriptional regulator/antitoxin component of YhaV-PrlF toxin-antitoxin module
MGERIADYSPPVRSEFPRVGMENAVSGRACGMLRASISSQLPHFCFSAMLQTMKATLTMTARGVITLPEKLREFLGLSADDQLIAETTPKGLLLRPAVTLPIEMYSEERLREFDEAEAELAAVLNGKAGQAT